jgi:hypothetical protein
MVAAADSASDQWMPMALPTRPTEMPMKARKPRLASGCAAGTYVNTDEASGPF